MFAVQIGIHHEDLELHRGIINLPDHKIDAMIWKQVNDESVRRLG
jgi:hypothetical protein